MKRWLILLQMLSSAVIAETTFMERGPAPLVMAVRDFNLYDIYIEPPPASATYAPGTLSVYLSRENPNFMRIPLSVDKEDSGRLHARINIDPKQESAYYIYVYDQQPNRGKQLLLLDQKLTKFVVSTK